MSVMMTTPVARAALPATYGGFPSYPQVAGGFGYGAAGFGGMGMGMGYPTIDPARVEEMKAAQAGQIVEQAQAIKARVGHMSEHQCMLIDARTDAEIQTLTAQINARREQSKMQVTQGTQQRAFAVDQRQVQSTSQVEQQALAMAGMASQAHFGMGFAGVDPARVEEMKAAQVGQIVEQAQAIKAQLSQAQEHQCMVIDTRADQEIQVLVGQLNARREQSKMQANLGGQQQAWAVDQRQAQSTTQLEQQAMAMAAQARQQETMRSAMGSYVPPVGGFGMGGMF